MIEVRREDFSIDEIVGKIKSLRTGAMITYLGTVREFPSSNGLEFENDKYVTKKLEEIEKKAINRFDIADVAIIHRVGFLRVTEKILLIAVSASRRGPAFDACKCIIDDVKDFHKSWKKEVRK